MQTVFNNRITAIVFCLLSLQCCKAESEEFYGKLRLLEPLPKPHFSWFLEPKILDSYEDKYLYQLARITHALSFSGFWATEKQVDNCVYTCARVNKTNPKIACSIGINYSPWHVKFNKDLPPTDRGPSYYDELNCFEEKLNNIKKWISKANKKYGTDVKVGAVLLDSERFYVKKGDDVWNEAIREALDAIHIRAKAMYPDARIEWYARGVGSIPIWDKEPTFTGREILTTLSCEMYSIPDFDYTCERYNRTCDWADKYKVEHVTPWVALGSGWRRDEALNKKVWDDNWDYDLSYSYKLGEAINQNKGKFDRAECVVFFPRPFNTGSPAWVKHFIAYVRGASGVKELSDLRCKE